MVAKGEGGRGGMGWDFQISRCKLSDREWINSKTLLYGIGNHTQYPLINHNGKLYIYKTESLCCTAGTKIALLINYISINKINFLENHSLTFKSKDYFISIQYNEQLL